MKSILISHMSWTEYKEYVENNDTIIIPTGVMEEHGLHNPLGTDCIIAEKCAQLIGERASVAVAPTLPYGVAPGMTNFAGTISLEPMLYRKILISYAESYIKTGIKRILFINGHGGNSGALSAVCQDLYAAHGTVAVHNEWWFILPKLDPELPCGDHGGLFETSCMLALAPHVVDMSKAKNCPEMEFTSGIKRTKGWRFRNVAIDLQIPLDTFQKVGNLGPSPLAASEDIGRKMVEKYVNYNVELLGEMKKITFKKRCVV